MQPTPAHNHFNPDLLAVMPPNVQHVVEVGCSFGALAKAYKQQWPQSIYVGVEIDEQYASIARQHCDYVLVSNFEKVHLDTFQAYRLGSADCYVFGDTLEHFVDPWKVLSNIRSTINSSGVVCACIPNMQHWSVQLKLLHGRLYYEKSGLLDRTHLRWFTRETIIKLFFDCGFKVELIEPRIFAREQDYEICKRIGEFAYVFGIDSNSAKNNALPIQYVLRAFPV